jgi:predicted acetyltransferase
MKEIRTIRESEGVQFLRLLCDVFELDFDRASGIFFNEPLFDLKRKWALFEGNRMVSVLTTVPLEFGWGRAIGIAGVATLATRQREGLARILLEKVLRESERAREGPALLFAKDERLYSACGFGVLDSVVRSSLRGAEDGARQEILSFSDIQGLYDRWSQASDSRLRRDEKRWSYWKWNLRVCTATPGGYICHEGSTIRELVCDECPPKNHLGEEAEWFGLRSMAAKIGLELEAPLHELHLMGRGFEKVPELFMTDQF